MNGTEGVYLVSIHRFDVLHRENWSPKGWLDVFKYDPYPQFITIMSSISFKLEFIMNWWDHYKPYLWVIVISASFRHEHDQRNTVTVVRSSLSTCCYSGFVIPLIWSLTDSFVVGAVSWSSAFGHTHDVDDDMLRDKRKRVIPQPQSYFFSWHSWY